MKPVLVYIYALDGAEGYCEMAHRFISTYRKFPPGHDHDTVIVCNGREPSLEAMQILGGLPNATFFPHDDSGQDIGGYIAACKTLPGRVVLCCGGSVYFHRAGWLARMMDVWNRHGPGFYGSQSSYEVTPHLNTTGFWCPSGLLSSYPYPVVTKEDRYNFEHGKANLSQNIDRPDLRTSRAIWRIANRSGMPVRFVTWDGEYEWWDWRKPPEIFRRGEQRNLLLWWKLTDHYWESPLAHQRIFARGADTLTDPDFNLLHRSFK